MRVSRTQEGKETFDETETTHAGTDRFANCGMRTRTWRRGQRFGKKLGVSTNTFYRWQSQYGGMKTDAVKRLRDLEKENSRLKKAVADLTLDKQILKEAIEGKY